MPDVENLKALSVCLDVSTDYLLGASDMAAGRVLKQAINPDTYPKAKGNSLGEDFIVLEYYPTAENIWQLSRERKLSKKEKVLDFIFPGVQYISDHWRDPGIYYLVEQNQTQFLISVTGEFIISQKLTHQFAGECFELGDQIFTKTRRKVLSGGTAVCL